MVGPGTVGFSSCYSSLGFRIYGFGCIIGGLSMLPFARESLVDIIVIAVHVTGTSR